MTLIKMWEGFGAPKRVQFVEGGEIFELPPDLPAELYFEIMGMQDRDDITETESFRTVYDGLLELCRYKKPKLEKIPIGLAQLITAVARIYGQAAEPEETPPRRARAGTTSSRSRAKTTRKR